MTKRVLLFLPFVALVFLVLFWKPIVRNVLNGGMKFYCWSHFGADFYSDGFAKEGDYWVFQHPRVMKKETHFRADRMSIHMGFTPFGWRGINHVHVENGQLEVGGDFIDPNQSVIEILKRGLVSKILRIENDFKIRKGHVSWVDVSEERAQHSADFSLHLHSDSHNQSFAYQLNFDQTEGITNSVEVAMLKQRRQPFQGNIYFNDVDCPKVVSLLEAITETSDRWKVSQGKCFGMLHFVGLDEEKPSLWGDLTLSDVELIQPHMEMSAKFQEMKFSLQNDSTSKGKIPLFGRIQIGKEASVVIHSHQHPVWEIQKILGTVEFFPGPGMKIDLSGDCFHQGRQFGLEIMGNGALHEDSQASIDALFRFQNPEGEPAEAKFSARQLGGDYDCVEMQLHHFGKHEISFLQTALGKSIPEIQDFTMHSGTLDASGIAYFQGFQLTDLKIEKLQSHQLHLQQGASDFSLRIREVLGGLSLNLAAENISETLEADFSVEGGAFEFQLFPQETCTIEEIETHFSVRKGKFEKSILEGKCCGLSGTVTFDWQSKDEEVKFDFKGKATQFTSLLPEGSRKNLETSFSKDRVQLLADMTLGETKAVVNGKLKVFPQGKREQETIHFGFQLEKSSEELWKRWPADHLARSFWESVGHEAMQSVMPPVAGPATLFTSNWMRAEAGIGGLVVRKGWFQGENLPLRRYVAPFALQKESVKLEGIGNFRGVFDHQLMAVEYDAKDVSFVGESFALEAKEIKTFFNKKNQKTSYAVHYFDFAKGTHYGSIPLIEATYLEKNSGLLFSNIHSEVILEDEKVHFTSLETECEGLYFAGGIDLNFGLPNDGNFEIEIRSDTLKGRASQAKKLLGNFFPDQFLNYIVIDGDLSFREENASVKFQFQPDDYQLQASIEGKLTNGTVSLEESGAVLKNVGFNFSYHHEKQLFELTHLHGRLSGGEEIGQAEYELSGEYFRMSDFKKLKTEYDLWLGDTSRDLFRLVGGTRADPQEDGTTRVSFFIDQNLTHFGDLRFGDFQLSLKDWTEINEFHLALHVKLSSFLSDLHHMNHAGLFFFSKPLAKGLRNVKSAKGDLHIGIEYEQVSNNYSFDLHGNNLEIGDQVIRKGALRGKKSIDRWVIDELLFDDLRCSAEVESKKNGWGLIEAQMHYGDGFEMTLENGEIDENHSLKAHVSLLQIEMDKLRGWPTWDLFVEECNPHGTMKGSGEIKFDFAGGKSSWKFEAIFDTSFHSWDMKKLHFQDVKNVSCHFVSDKGITLRNLHTTIVNPKTGSTRAKIHIDKTFYDFMTKDFLFDHLRFHIPSHHLPWFAEAMAVSFPKLFVPPIADVVRSVKLQGNVDGTLHYELAPPYVAFRLTLDDGTYHFLNNEYDLSGFVLEYDPFEFKVTSQYQIGAYPVWLYARSTSPTLRHGSLFLTQNEMEHHHDITSAEGIKVLWQNDSDMGIFFDEAEGKLVGLSVKLQRDREQPLSEKMMFLEGTVNLSLQEAKGLFPDEIAQKIVDWKIGKGYSLEGKWRYHKASTGDYSSKLQFTGALAGKDFELKGYQFDTLKSSSVYTPTAIELKDLQLTDVAGMVAVGKVGVYKTKDDTWEFSIPKVDVSKFRPSLLKEVGQMRPVSSKPLMVRELTLNGFRGSFVNSSTITGQGSLYFTNHPKKLLQNTIFQIPADIIARLGLDPSVLTPASGSISYEIKDGKIFLTKFKDMVSEGKLSKFLLANNPMSYLDFSGNMNLAVRMKQYNLLFKFTEPFIVTIQGNLEKPIYSLQKQRKDRMTSKRTLALD